MQPREIFQKTMPFVWAKLLLGVITVGVSAVLLGILLGLAALFGSETLTLILLVVWIALVGVFRFVLMHYFGYLVKAGHVAVIAQAVTTGRVPDNQVAYGKQLVTERFVTANVYFGLDKLVSGAVKQLQRVVEKAGNLLDAIPGIGAVVSLAKFFIEISLGYIDECCLGYTFYKKDQGAFQSAADGVVIYAQNWKVLLGSAAKTMAIVLGLLAVLVVVLSLVLGGLLALLGVDAVFGVVLAVLIALAVKFAFMDSYILVKMMCAYMEVAPTTQITYDLYSKLCGLSKKFKELFGKAQAQAPSQPAYAQAAPSPAAAGSFCGQCGAQNAPGTRFCGGCGARLG